MTYLQLFWEFFKTGLFSIGGGMATVPFLFRLSDSTGWFSYSELADMIAVSESTPGPVGVNMATFVGYSIAGISGGVVATLGLILPSILVILVISRILDLFRSSKYVDAAFRGLRPASLALISAAGLGISLQSVSFEWKQLLLAAVLIVFTRFVRQTKDLHPIVFILFSAAAGLLL